MAQDPISRLQFARDEIDRVFGENFAAANPSLVSAVMSTAATDFAALTIARAIDRVAAALTETELIVDERPVSGIIRAHVPR
jgi:hypothetical protein